MKFSLTITEATAEEIAAFLNKTDSLRQEMPAIQPITTAEEIAAFLDKNNSLREEMPAIQPITTKELAAFLDKNNSLRQEMPAIQPITTKEINEAPEAPQQPVQQPSEAPIQSAQSAPEFDSDGVAWDESVHALTKTKKKDGTWTRKRGISDEEYNRGIAELKQMYPAPSSTTAPASQLAPVQDNFTPRPGMVSEAPVTNVPPTFNNPAPAPSSVTQPAPQPSQPQANQKDYGGLINTLSDLFGKKEITANYYSSLVARINEDFADQGVSILSLDAIATNNDLVNYAWECLRVDGLAS